MNTPRRLPRSPGWDTILADLHRRMIAVFPDIEYTAKSKQGRLRVDTDRDSDQRVRTMTFDAELLSMCVCESCGKEGTPRWSLPKCLYRTLCPSCAVREGFPSG